MRNKNWLISLDFMGNDSFVEYYVGSFLGEMVVEINLGHILVIEFVPLHNNPLTLEPLREIQ